MIWRRIPERYNLMGSKCETCDQEYFPARKICPACRRKGKLVPKSMPQEGKIYSYSEVHAAPAGFEFETPYFLAILELTNGVRLLAQLVDSPAETVKIGARAKLVFRRIAEDGKEGVISYGYKFKTIK